MGERLFRWSRKDASKPPRLLAFRSSKLIIVSACCVAAFTDVFLYSIVVPVIPFALTVRAGVSPEDVQHWTSALLGCYAGALLVASPICGWLADHSSSRRLPFVLGLLALGGSTILLCVGSSIGFLVLGRLLEGLSGAVVWTSGSALLVDTVGEKQIGKMMGYWSFSITLGVLLGPFLGGIVFARSGYYEVFAMAFLLIVLDVVLRLVLVEKKDVAQRSAAPTERDGRFWVGIRDRDGTPRIVPSPGTESFFLFGTTVITNITNTETSMINPKAPPATTPIHNLPPVVTLLRSRRLLTALWATLVQSAILCAFDSVLPLFVHRVFGWGPIGAGLIFLAFAIPSFASPLVGWTADRYGPRWLVTIGFTSSLPLLVLLRLVMRDSTKQIVLLCGILLLLGVSNAFLMATLMAEIAWIVRAKEKKDPGMFGEGGAYAQAYGLFFCWFAGGALIGPIWAGFLEQKAGWGTMTWTLGLVSGLTAIPVVCFTGRGVTKERDGRTEAP